MERTAVAQLFRQLTTADLRGLALWVRSPAHNQREEVALLYEYLATAEPSEGGEASRRAQFAAAFPGEPFDDKRLRRLHGHLRDVLFAFLAHGELAADAQRSRVHLVRALRKRRAEGLFEREWAAALDELESSEHRHAGHFKRKAQLHLERSEHDNARRRGGGPHLQEMTDALTTHTLADLLRHGSALLADGAVSGRAYRFALLDAALATIERQPELLDEPIVAAYFHVFQLQKGGDGGIHFEPLARLLAERWRLFPEADSRDLYLFAINFCIKRMNSGERAFVRRALDLYRSGLDSGLLLDGGQLSPYAYNNILLIALNLGERDWARAFLDNWKAALPAHDRENTYLHNLSLFHYRTGDFENAMATLQKVEFREPLRFLESRRMLLRIYFELGHHDALSSLLDSLRVYLYRKDGLGYHRGSYLNLIKILKKVLAGAEREAVLREVRELPVLAEREWLVGVLGEKRKGPLPNEGERA